MPIFPSEEWVAAWVALANRSPEFEASGSGWEGALGLVIEADAERGVAGPVYVRLEGRDGKWIGSELGTSPALVEGTVFVLRGPYRRWKELVRQELDPTKGLLQGKLRIRGHLPDILKWTQSMAVLAELAGRIDTEFVDEPARDSSSRETRGA